MDTAAPERRGGDRRYNDRRTPGRRASDAWGGGESFFDPGWLTGQDARTAAENGSALARIYRTYAAARAALGIALVVTQGVSSLLGTRAVVVVTMLCLAYAAQAVMLWLLPRFRGLAAPQAAPALRRRQWLATIGVDLATFGALHVIDNLSSFNYGALLVLPVLMAGVMTQRLVALATASGVALMLLVVAWQSAAPGDLGPAMVRVGVGGIGLFFIAIVAGELAGRLAREELAARGSLEMARQQAQLNRLIIEEMVDGVLVVDRTGRVRAANPAARALLVDVGLSPPAPFDLAQRPVWAELAHAAARALDELVWPEAGREVTLHLAGGERRTLRMRVRFMRRGSFAAAAATAAAEPGESLAVLLLEDVRTAQARMRQEKLAAMGRVSAGIAHEIRNPLAAIAQANALLLEDAVDPGQQQLARIVADNVARLKRIVDDVMELAPGLAPEPYAIDAGAEVTAVVGEWARTVGLPLGAGSRLQVELPPRPSGVLFDPDHLRRVLVNLLDNANRHGGPDPGAIVLRLAAPEGDEAAVLTVANDGPPIPHDVERFLFEPFFSTRSRGTGLGLYICRELCERYGASIDYRARPAGEQARNEFVVTMRRAALAAESSLAAPPLFSHP